MLITLGWIIIECFQEIDFISVLLAVAVALTNILVYPFIYKYEYHTIKKQCGYLYRY